MTINLMQDLLHIIILKYDDVTKINLTVKYDDVIKINLMQELLHIIILDCKYECDKNRFDARFITYNYLRL